MVERDGATCRREGVLRFHRSQKTKISGGAAQPANRPNGRATGHTANTSETIMSHNKPTDVESKTEQVLRDLRAVKSKELVIRQEAHGSTTLIYGVGTSQHRPLESIEQAVQIERIKAKSRENTAEIISFIEPLRLRLQIKREWLAARSGGRRKPSELQGKYPEAWAAAEEKFVAVASVHPN